MRAGRAAARRARSKTRAHTTRGAAAALRGARGMALAARALPKKALSVGGAALAPPTQPVVAVPQHVDAATVEAAWAAGVRLVRGEGRGRAPRARPPLLAARASRASDGPQARTT